MEIQAISPAPSFFRFLCPPGASIPVNFLPPWLLFRYRWNLPEYSTVFYIHAQHNALTTKRFGTLCYYFQVHPPAAELTADFFRSCQNYFAHIFQITDTAATENGIKMSLLPAAPHQIIISRCRKKPWYRKKNNFIQRPVHNYARLHRIADIPHCPLNLIALGELAVAHVQAGGLFFLLSMMASQNTLKGTRVHMLALRCVPRCCGVRQSTPHASCLASGAFCKVVCNYRTLIFSQLY